MKRLVSRLKVCEEIGDRNVILDVGSLDGIAVSCVYVEPCVLRVEMCALRACGTVCAACGTVSLHVELCALCGEQVAGITPGIHLKAIFEPIVCFVSRKW